MNIEPRDPKSLKRHPLHKAHVPAPDKQTPEWKAFADTVHANGKVAGPIRGTKDGFVVDGWWAREAACDWQFLEVPYELVADDQAALIIVESLTARKQMTRGATVYLALGLLPEYAKAAEGRRVRNHIAKRTTNEQAFAAKEVSSTRQSPGSVRYLAERWGCNHQTVHQATLVRSHLHDLKIFSAWLKSIEVKAPADKHAQLQADLRAEFEPLLFNGEKSLWTVLQAAAGRLTTKDQPKHAAEQLELFQSGLRSVITRVLKLDDLAAARNAIAEELSNVQDKDVERLLRFAGELARAAKERATNQTKPEGTK